MSETKTNKEALEMLIQAENSDNYTGLKERLDDIRQKMSDSINPPSKDVILSAFSFLEVLKERKTAYEKMKGQISEESKVKLNNLKDEFDIYSEIQSKLGEIGRIKIQVRDEDRSSDFQSFTEIINYLVTDKKSDGSYEFKIKTIKSIRDNNTSVVSEEDMGESPVFTELKDMEKYLSTDKTKKQEEKSGSQPKGYKEKPREDGKKPESKEEKTKIAGFNAYKEAEVKVDEEKIKLPKDEVDAIKNITGLNLEDVNYRSLFKLASKLKSSEDIDSKDTLKSIGYEPTGLLGWRIYKDEFSQAQEFQKTLKDKNNGDKLLGLLEYYKSGKTAIDAQKDSEILKQYKPEQVLEYLANTDKTFSALDSKVLLNTLNTSYNKGNNKSFFVGLKKMIESFGGIKITEEINDLTSLYKAIEKNPTIKLGFQKGVNFLSGLTGEYLKNGGDISDYNNKLNNGLKKLNESIEKAYGEKIKQLKSSIDGKIKEIESKIEKGEITKEAGNEAIAELSLFKQEGNDKGFFDYFRLKSLELFGSLVKGKEGGGMTARIANDFDNEIINKIDIEIGFFATADGKILPGIGLSISGEKDFTPTVQGHGTIGVNIYGAYVLVGINKQVNYSDIQNAKFEFFDKETSRIGIYGNAGIGFFGGVTYGAGLYYKENKEEAIKQKREQLAKIIDKFSNIKNTQEIDKIILDEGIESEDLEIIKNDIKLNLMGLGFDAASESNKKHIFEKIKEAKLNIFNEVAYRMAQEKGWNWSGAALGVQFIAGFFPTIVAGIQFSKTSLKSEKNKAEELRNRIVAIGSVEPKKGEGPEFFDSISKEAKEKLGFNMEFIKEGENRGLFRISGYNGDGNIIGKDGDKTALNFDPELEKEIKVVGSDIFIGNVGTIGYLPQEVEGGILKKLILGKGGQDLEGNGEKFSKNNPTSLIIEGEKIETKTEVEKTGEYEVEKTLFEDYFSANVGKITSGVAHLGSAPSIAYKELVTSVNSGDLFKIRDSIIKLLTIQSKRKVLTGNTKEIIENLKKIDNKPELATIIAQAFDSIFSTQDTDRRIGKDRKTKKGEHDIYDMSTKSLEGPGRNRRDAFSRLAKKDLGTNASEIIGKREERVKLDKGMYGWKVDTESGKDVFAMVATYRVAYKDGIPKGNKPVSLGKGFVPMPPGTITMAGGKYEALSNVNKEELYSKLFREEAYRDHVKWIIEMNIKHMDNTLGDISISDEQLKDLIINKDKGITINGKTFKLPKAEFILFMYGRCYNESVGLKLGQLEMTTPGSKGAPKYRSVNLNAYPQTTTGNIATGDTRTVGLGVAMGQGEKPKGENGDGGNGGASTQGGDGGTGTRVDNGSTTTDGGTTITGGATPTVSINTDNSLGI